MFLKKTQFPRTFWAANTLEVFERWAYYGVFNLLALYLTGSQETGALGFSQVEKGMVMGIVNAILYFLPVITGSLADRFGYKKILIIAFAVLSSGYYLMGQVSSFAGVFLTFFYVAIGAALFKPIISATIARTTDESNSSVGFGIFYMIVNIGGLIGPIVASELREISWSYVFIMSAAAILLNLIIVLIFYKEPDRVQTEEPFMEGLRQAFRNIYIALKDVKFTLFLLIIIAGWTVFWQIFFSLPVYIDQWIDTGVIYDSIHGIFPGFADAISTNEGTILAEKLITMDALFIVAFQILISRLVIRFKPINTMIAGFLINAIGITLAMMTRNGWFLVLSIFIFSLGEMSFSPKVLEYVGRIAPKDKAALYMGTYFLPIAAGNLFAGLLSGKIYELTADKFVMLNKEVARWGLDIPAISESFSQNDYMQAAAKGMGMNVAELTQYLWLNYNPPLFGLILMGLGVLTCTLLIIYDKIIFRYK
ncbi:MAG TPA: MFS transporter [Bacteroides sp.]|nr:MFS transporter [Bacteroides sp.]